MFWKKKRTVENIFRQHYGNALEIIEQSDLCDEIENLPFEVASAMTVISDFAAASAKKDRIQIYTEITKRGLHDATTQNLSMWQTRMDFYGSIIRGRKLRGDFMPFADALTLATTTAIAKCTIALCDCLINPMCIDNYDNAPIKILDIFACADFCESIYRPLTQEFHDLFNDIYSF